MPRAFTKLPLIDKAHLKFFESVRFSRRKELTKIDQNEFVRDFLYLEVQHEVFGRLSKIVPVREENLAERLNRWLDRLREFVGLPEADEMDSDLIEYSPSTFGYLLHESLGHRLESDDFKAPFSFSSFQPVAFDVWDLPGEPGWPGYCPIDDMGTKAKPVQLFNGKTGSQKFLSAKTGNLRAIHHGWHPIVRQRTLCVSPHAQIEIPAGSKVVIDEVSHGTFRDERAILETGLQKFETKKGKVLRLPPLRLEFTLEHVCDLRPFGDIVVSHPGGGCDKGAQRGLGISFCCPSAWSRLDVSGLKLEIL